MSSYPTCRECGSDLTSAEEEEQELCLECQRTETFTVELKNGQEVNVTWHKDYFKAVDHLELRGPMTETGYKSEFLPKQGETELSRDFVVLCATLLAQKCWDDNQERYGKQLTLTI
jgi:hypothetical protein